MRLKPGYIVIGLSLIIGLSAISFFLLPGYHSIVAVRESTIETRINQDETDQLSQRNSALAEKYRQLEANLGKLNDRLLTTTSALNLITALESMASDRSLVLALNKLETPALNSTISTIDLSVTGSVSDVLLFLRELESSQWLVNFEIVSLATASSLARSTDIVSGVTLSLIGKIYWSTSQ